MTTNDKIKAVAEEMANAVMESAKSITGESAFEGAEKFAYQQGFEDALAMVYIDLTGTPNNKGVLQHRLETLVREEKEELLLTLLKSLPLRSDWDDDEKVTFSMAVGAMREVLESYRPPITNNKN